MVRNELPDTEVFFPSWKHWGRIYEISSASYLEFGKQSDEVTSSSWSFLGLALRISCSGKPFSYRKIRMLDNHPKWVIQIGWWTNRGG